MNEEITKAVNDAIDYIAHGWNIETAILSAHDTVHDIIEVDEFITLAQIEIKRMCTLLY